MISPSTGGNSEKAGIDPEKWSSEKWMAQW